MSQPKYLYGAAVQGIQSFILGTDKLKEITGASEIVNDICTTIFARQLGYSNDNDLEKDQSVIVAAAGNIKYLFDTEEQCKKLVLNFPKAVAEYAPGLSLSQAIVKIEGEIQKKHFDELEKKLRAQRNRPLRSSFPGFHAFERSRRTGLPLCPDKEQGKYLDHGTLKKIKAFRESYRLADDFYPEGYNRKDIPKELETISNSKGENYSWLAVVHADGNNLGNTIQKLANEVNAVAPAKYGEVFRQFSQKLDEATKKAAQEAFAALKESIQVCRPTVLGGDDLTVIIRADLALQFTENFLRNFEDETQRLFREIQLNGKQLNQLQNGLTACAGIAYVKDKYPFHYAYNLAEQLCGKAKKLAKPEVGTTPSCLLFHKVQDSFVEDFETIRQRELTAGNTSFFYGPYYLHPLDHKSTIAGLQEKSKALEGKEGNAVKSHLRNWLSELHRDELAARQLFNRMLSFASGKTAKIIRELDLTEESAEQNPTPVYDWLTIHSINQGGK